MMVYSEDGKAEYKRVFVQTDCLCYCNVRKRNGGSATRTLIVEKVNKKDINKQVTR